MTFNAASRLRSLAAHGGTEFGHSGDLAVSRTSAWRVFDVRRARAILAPIVLLDAPSNIILNPVSGAAEGTSRTRYLRSS